MNETKLTAAVLAVLLVTTGVGAVAPTPGNGDTPDNAGSNAANAPMTDANLGAEENASQVTDDGTNGEEVARRANVSESANDSAAMADPADASEDEAGSEAAAAADEERRGPPTDVPGQVPDHVSEIHQRIVSFLDGELDDLGAAVSDVTPKDGDESADAENEDAESADSEPETAAQETEEPETEDGDTETEDDSEYTETVTTTAEA
jgi:hypothetical protein